MTYAKRKALERAKVMVKCLELSEKRISWGELSFWSEHFTKVARKYGLVKEFRENGII